MVSGSINRWRVGYNIGALIGEEETTKCEMLFRDKSPKSLPLQIHLKCFGIPIELTGMRVQFSAEKIGLRKKNG